jgi:ketosteroid isomerase-like protein
MCNVIQFRSIISLAFSFLLVSPHGVSAQQSRASAAESELRQVIRQYDEALRRVDVAAIERVFAQEYFFVNPRGQRVTRAERLANLREGRTTLDTVVHAPRDEHFRMYSDSVVLYTAQLTLVGRYGGQAQQGKARAMVLWVKRDGRWQQAASQLTSITPP